MDTEPPVGDELQRMLVTMKQGVLERATPRPKRRRGHTGIVVGVVALLALGTASGAVALTLSQQDRPVAAPVQTQEPAPAPSVTTPTSAPITATPTPVPTTGAAPPDRADPTAVASIPTSCRGAVPAGAYDRLFGGREAIQVFPSPGGVVPSVSGSGVVTELYCLWGGSDGPGPGLALTVGTANGEQLASRESSFFGDQDTVCSVEGPARVCRASSTDVETGAAQARTWYSRGDTWVEIDQADFPTDGLLDAVVGEIWGD
ncbi:hypothetical protein [Curtobacterium sp. 1310]|uniref:hypothetical protein n=1 Tax=Curtobacterium sp. 1310 TaxID=2806570 RepID=UPI001AE7BC9F|nr:hypothetical protein [Curtobacterium sp. 1310]MBP1301500.1 hypothetical protein [Curtobacterium sp. 1310]